MPYRSNAPVRGVVIVFNDVGFDGRFHRLRERAGRFLLVDQAGIEILHRADEEVAVRNAEDRPGIEAAPIDAFALVGFDDVLVILLDERFEVVRDFEIVGRAVRRMRFSRSTSVLWWRISTITARSSSLQRRWCVW